MKLLVLKLNIIVATSILVACASSGTGATEANHENNTEKKHLYPIKYYGHSVSGDTLLVQVESTGCTTAQQVSATVTEGPQQKVALALNAPDRCRRAPFVSELRINSSQLGINLNKPFVITNPKLQEQPYRRK